VAKGYVQHYHLQVQANQSNFIVLSRIQKVLKLAKGKQKNFPAKECQIIVGNNGLELVILGGE